MSLKKTYPWCVAVDQNGYRWIYRIKDEDLAREKIAETIKKKKRLDPKKAYTFISTSGNEIYRDDIKEIRPVIYIPFREELMDKLRTLFEDEQLFNIFYSIFFVRIKENYCYLPERQFVIFILKIYRDSLSRFPNRREKVERLKKMPKIKDLLSVLVGHSLIRNTALSSKVFKESSIHASFNDYLDYIL